MLIAAAVTLAVCFAVAFVLLRRAGFALTRPAPFRSSQTPTSGAGHVRAKPFSWGDDRDLYMSLWREELAAMPTASVVVAFPRGAPKASIEEWME